MSFFFLCAHLLLFAGGCLIFLAACAWVTDLYAASQDRKARREARRFGREMRRAA